MKRDTRGKTGDDGDLIEGCLFMVFMIVIMIAAIAINLEFAYVVYFKMNAGVTTGTVTRIDKRHTTKVFINGYTIYYVEGKRYGSWLDSIRARYPRVGKQIKIYYDHTDPRRFYTEYEPSFITLFFSWILLLFVIFIRKWRKRQMDLGTLSVDM